MANLLSTSITGTATTSDRIVIGGTFANNAYNSVGSTRLHFGGGDSDANSNYYIGTNLNNYGGNYTKLDLRWHTGIRMGARPEYGGIRFFNNEALGSRIMSIGETDANVRIDNNLWIGGAGGWITDLLAGKLSTGGTAANSSQLEGFSAYALVTEARGAHSGSDFPNGTLVTTDINANVWAGDSFIMEVSGKSYGSGTPFKLIMEGYLYADTIINVSAMSYGSYFPAPVKVMRYNGNIAFWWPRGSYWNSFEVHVRSANGDSWNRVTGITDSVDPASADKKISITPTQVIHTGNIGSQSVSYASSAGNADTVGGRSVGNGKGNVGYFDSNGNLYINNPESYSGEVRLGAAWGYGGVYASGVLSLSTSSSNIYFVFNNSIPISMGNDASIALSGSTNTPVNITGSAHKYLTINPGNGYEAMVRYIGGSGSSWYVGKRTSSQLIGTESFHFYSEAAGATVGGINPSGDMIVTGSMRAPIFYDSNDTGYYLDPNGSSNLNTVTANQYYANGWFRNYGAQGIYNESYGNHWYATSNATWNAAGNNGSYVEIAMRTGGHQGSIRGYFYADSSANIGILNNAGNWSLLTNSSRNTTLYGQLTVGEGIGYSSIYMTDSDEGTREIHCNSNRIGFLNQSSSWGSWCYDDGSWATGVAMYSPIYYDSDDTGFYLDPNGTSNLRKFSTFTMAYNSMNPLSANSPYVDRYNGSAGYRNGTMGYGNTDFNTIARNWGSGFIDTWSSPANAPGGSSHYIGLQGVHYSDGGTSFYGFQMACAGEADNRFFWRSSWPSMRSWVEMIHSGNIGSQNVNASNYQYATGSSSDAIAIFRQTPAHATSFREISSSGPGGTWWMIQNFRHSNSSNYWGTQVAWGWEDNALRLMQRNVSADSWSGWVEYLNTNNAAYAWNMNQYVRTSDAVTFASTTTQTFLIASHSDNTKGYRIYNTSNSSVSAMFVNSSNQLVIAAGAVDQVNLNKKVYVNGVALGVNVAPSATAGRIDASNDIVAYSSSDERLKYNITPIENALDKVKSLTGVEFDWKPEYKHAHGYEGHDTGIIAQQVDAVMPSAVRTNDTGFLAVRYEKLIGLLIEGMKEQQAQIDELKAKLDGLTK